ncbi:hypothetical protein ERJ75_001069200 [Trypanosoma vivax]|nr:hypothetical protein ERJ75_001069200 [Trypanosoma vivax]
MLENSERGAEWALHDVTGGRSKLLEANNTVDTSLQTGVALLSELTSNVSNVLKAAQQRNNASRVAFGDCSVSSFMSQRVLTDAAIEVASRLASTRAFENVRCVAA